MAKFASIIITLLFAVLVSFAALETLTVVEAQKLCYKPSKTWTGGVCRDRIACKNQCVNFEGARYGSCTFEFPHNKCRCYFQC
ncbi:unnamed protein product [Arabis nemorensis]|uniref:Knottins-like domain-containing protein n=1 Tax=Arabis nemorensis TaxID=586526 RepID=A0A565B163_9BRAS|nr:unnamed protein product [Arabis nemorensis]